MCPLPLPSQSLPALRQPQSHALVEADRQPSADAVTNLVPRISSRKVCEDDEVVLETIGEVGDVVDVDVPVAGRAILMAVVHERALDHQHLGLECGVARLEK